jgi:hypothetical protein
MYLVELFTQAQVLRARWMKESDRFETTHVMKAFMAATELQAKCDFFLFSCEQ